jgi:hypothetical protein
MFTMGEPTKGVLLATLRVGNRFVTDQILDNLAPVGSVRNKLDGSGDQSGGVVRQNIIPLHSVR